MASTWNVKTLHKDGKAEVKIGIDENAKIIEGEGKEVVIKNTDGTSAKISKENIPGMPDDVSDENKLVTEADLIKMKQEILKGIKSQADSLQSLLELAKIVGTIGGDDNVA